MSARCEQCRRKIRGAGVTTPTMRRLCTRCGRSFEGRAAGLMAGGGIAGAIATSGWYQRITRLTKPTRED